MSERKQIVSVLFSDIKGYSSLNDYELFSKVKRFNDDFEMKVLNQANHFHLRNLKLVFIHRFNVLISTTCNGMNARGIE